MRTTRLLAGLAVVLGVGCSSRSADPDASELDARDGASTCMRTNDRASVAVHLPPHDDLSCANTSGLDGGGSRIWIGQVTSSDASSLVIDTHEHDACVDDASCAAGQIQVEAQAPGLDLTRFPRVWVQVKAKISRFYVCQQSLEVTTAAPGDGSTAPGPVGQLLLAVVDGGATFTSSPYEVDHVQLPCAGRTNTAGAYAFDFKVPADPSATLRVYMGEDVPWQSGGATYRVRNLRSFETGNYDDYWNWAYTIYVDPK